MFKKKSGPSVQTYEALLMVFHEARELLGAYDSQDCVPIAHLEALRGLCYRASLIRQKEKNHAHRGS